MDEAGNTGQDVLNAAQPVYALAGVHVSLERAQELVDGALEGRQATELKFKTLRRRTYGPALLRAVLEAADFAPEEARIAVLHKRWMAVAKMVDTLVEPAMVAKGLQMAFYGGGAHVGMTNDLYLQGGTAMGIGVWDDLLRSFLAMAHHYGDATVDAYLRALRRARISCRNEVLHAVLLVMIDAREDLDAELGGASDVLDPAVAAVFWQAGEWSDQFDEFVIVHDDAEAVERWSDPLIRAGKAKAENLEVGKVTLKFPGGLSDITFVRSHDDPRVQLADLLAGSAAWLYAALFGFRSDDAISIDLERAGLPTLVQDVLGPPVDSATVSRMEPG